MKRLVIAGGSGFLGKALMLHFKNSFDEIVILSRSAKSPHENVRYEIWNGRDLDKWENSINGADVLINLAGKSVNCRYTGKNKKTILNSRIDSTRVLGEAIRESKNPPKVWLQAASSTIYRSSYDKIMNERNGEIGEDFSMNVCKQWERAFMKEECEKTRKIIMRIAIVLGKGGGAIPPTFLLTRLGLGGKQGSGKQMVSWIHEDDFARAVEWLIDSGKNKSIYNCTSPGPVINSHFMKSIREFLGVPFGIPSPSWLLEIGSFLIGTETELLLKSRWVFPQRLLDEGFVFKYHNLNDALENLS